MEHYKISKLLNDSTVSTFVTKKMDRSNDLSSGQYSVNKNIKLKTSMLRSNSCDYSDAYTIVKERITVEGDNDDKARNKKLIFKNNASFRSCILKINNTFIGNAEDLDIVMSMYNMLEYSDNYSMTSESLWNYYRDEMNEGPSIKYLCSNLVIFRHPLPPFYAFKEKNDVIKTIDVHICLDPLPPP